MEKIVLDLPGTSSVIYIGRELTDISDLIPDGKLAVITDSNLFRHYGDRFPEAPVIVLEPGEKSKSMDTVGSIYDKLVAAELDRKSFILGIGGSFCSIRRSVAEQKLLPGYFPLYGDSRFGRSCSNEIHCS